MENLKSIAQTSEINDKQPFNNVKAAVLQSKVRPFMKDIVLP